MIAFFPHFNQDDLEHLLDNYIKKFNPALNNNDVNLPISDLGYPQSEYIQRYHEIQIKKKALDLELEQLKPNLVSLLELNNGAIKTPFFNIYLASRKSIICSDNKDEDLVINEEGTTLFPVMRENSNFSSPLNYQKRL